MKKNKVKKICLNQNLHGFIVGHHDLLHGLCLFLSACLCVRQSQLASREALRVAIGIKTV